jgi:uncharacterized membrane protein (TIGR02234 family)
MRITRSAVLIATVVTSTLLLVAGAQPWVVVGLSSAESSARELIVTGGTLAPSFIGLSLAYAAALIVSLVSRRVVSIVTSVIAICAVLGAVVVSLVAVSEPVAAARVTIAGVTGVSDTVRQRDLIDSLALQPWAFIALIVLVVAAFVGVAVIAAGRSWTSNSRRFERPNQSSSPRGSRARNDESDPHATWDDFSGGGDPTRTPSR